MADVEEAVKRVVKDIDKALLIQENAKKIEEEYQKRLAEIIKMSEKEMTGKDCITEEDIKRIAVKRAYCPKCGQELISNMPKMFNPFTQESQCIHVCSNDRCKTKYNLEYAYPRIVFYNKDNHEIYGHCE